jgi:hypothetical protein
VPEQYQDLLEHWEAVLRDEADPFHTCVFCGEPVINRRPSGPRRLYCSARCRKAASRARKEATEPSDWVPAARAEVLLEDADTDGAHYIDAFPGDHPPLNAPVVPRESEPNSEFGWAWEIIGSADVT